ncbi:MAG: diacylglycerol kinase family protein [bacterium]|jgi:diacylglycerol kinase|nr:diacylglycerol kinase family protein [candidate division KSB1 bacterium]MDH7561475.1 diacylglycerol kinase family protein [bacterium]
MKQTPFSLRQRGRSFRFAFRGLALLLREEHNARIHLAAAVGVIVAGFLFRISAGEWLAVTFAIGLVFALELLNSAVERLADLVSPQRSEAIAKVKDLSAGGVLVGAMTALVIGLCVFVPKIVALR